MTFIVAHEEIGLARMLARFIFCCQRGGDNLFPVGGPVADLVGIEVGVVSGVMNLESSGVEASDWRLRHNQGYHEA